MLQWQSITNNCLFHWHKRNAHWTWTACFSNVTWIGQSNPGHHQELHWKQAKQMLNLPASLQWSYPILMISLFVWICDMITVVSLFWLCQNLNFMLQKLLAVIQDAVLGQCSFRLCQWSKQLVIDQEKNHGSPPDDQVTHFGHPLEI